MDFENLLVREEKKFVANCEALQYGFDQVEALGVIIEEMLNHGGKRLSRKRNYLLIEISLVFTTRVSGVQTMTPKRQRFPQISRTEPKQ